MMRIIFINRYFFPDHSATSQILSDLAFSLPQQPDQKIIIITSRLRYDDPEAVLPAYETLNNVEVFRVYTSRFGRANLVGRSLDYITFYVSAIIRLFMLARRNDLVVAKTDPPLISVAILPIIWLKRAKLVNWLQDLFPEVASALGIGKGKAAPLMSVLKGLRNRSLNTAQTNIVLGELMAQRLKDQGIASSKITIMPNWSDGDAITSLDHDNNPVRKEWGLGNRFVVGYSGNLGRAHDFSDLLEAATILDKQQQGQGGEAPQIIFLFIGSGAQRQSLEEQAKALGLSNVQFRPYQPRERLAQSLSAIDLHIVSLKPELEGLIVPSKFYGIAAAGRPTLFIGDPKGEIPLLLAKEKCGITVQAGNSANMANQILTLAKNPEQCQQMGQRVRRLFDQQFDKKILVGRWQQLLERLTKDLKS